MTTGKVDIHIDIAQDGSGWSLDRNHNVRPACIVQEPEGHFGYAVIVPFKTEAEKENYTRNTGRCDHGYKGIRVPNVKERYLVL